MYPTPMGRRPDPSNAWTGIGGDWEAVEPDDHRERPDDTPKGFAHSEREARRPLPIPAWRAC
jgi:hypothetical protein